tara:strand:- start:3352 stop:4506 length:1155 start_codon:yes stop_codon:yes gene_type:complete
MKKNILIVGPIVDFGGREIMTNLLFNALKDDYKVKIFSTVSISQKSVALKGIKNTEWNSLQRYIFTKKWFINLTALLTKTIYKKKEPAYYFIRNRLSKPFFNFEKISSSVLIKHLEEADLIIYSDEICGKWLKTILELSKQEKKIVLLRLTGEIKNVPQFLVSENYKFEVLAHSKQNAKAIKNKLNTKVWNIDQTTALEDKLLSLPIAENDTIIYGFLGRFGKEKGIELLINTFNKNNKNLIIAGNGPYLNDVLELAKQNKNVSYLGELAHENLPDFFNKIDVFIIPSFEEGGPIVGIEAMASGKLIISTRVGAMPERLENTEHNIWISHAEKNSLDLAINSIEKLSQEERLKIRHQLREKYISQNSFKFIKSEYLDVVQKLLA